MVSIQCDLKRKTQFQTQIVSLEKKKTISRNDSIINLLSCGTRKHGKCQWNNMHAAQTAQTQNLVKSNFDMFLKTWLLSSYPWPNMNDQYTTWKWNDWAIISYYQFYDIIRFWEIWDKNLSFCFFLQLLLLLMIWQSPGLPGWRPVRPHHPNIAACLYCLATSPGFLPTLCEK